LVLSGAWEVNPVVRTATFFASQRCVQYGFDHHLPMLKLQLPPKGT